MTEFRPGNLCPNSEQCSNVGRCLQADRIDSICNQTGNDERYEELETEADESYCDHPSAQRARSRARIILE
jgi:hypothetical protein